MVEGKKIHKRFSETADECRLGNDGTYHYDINGAVLRLLESLNSGLSMNKAKESIGGRFKDDDSEESLADTAEGFLFFSIKQTMRNIVDSPKKADIPKAYVLNTESIRLAIINRLEKNGEEEFAKEINLIPYEHFKTIMTVLVYRQRTLLQKYLEVLGG